MVKGKAGERKPRKDKGLVMATRRDLYCLAWIAEQYVVRSDQVRRLLSRFADPHHPLQSGKEIAQTTLRDQLERWRRAGWIEMHRALYNEPAWIWVTAKGLHVVDLDEYAAREPAVTRLHHLYGINQVRLWMDKKYSWMSERRYRAEELAKVVGKKGKSSGPIPDGVITTKWGRVAIEVEFSPKKPEQLEAKLARLVRHGYLVPTFAAIWFYVPDERIKNRIEEAREKLREDEQKRVSVVVQEDLRSSCL